MLAKIKPYLVIGGVAVLVIAVWRKFVSPRIAGTPLDILAI